VRLRALDVSADRFAYRREDVLGTELLEQSRSAKYVAHRRADPNPFPPYTARRTAQVTKDLARGVRFRLQLRDSLDQYGMLFLRARAASLQANRS
jgi:hypothetical protein